MNDDSQDSVMTTPFDTSPFYALTQTGDLAGFSIKVDQKQIVVHVAGSDTSATDQALLNGKLLPLVSPFGWTVTSDSVKYSFETLARINDSLIGTSSLANAIKPVLVTRGVDSDSNTVQVGVLSLDSALAALAKEQYGDALVFSLVPSRPVRRSRQTDTSPFDAGGRARGQVDASHYDDCSVGFQINISGAIRALSAGHCASGTGSTKIFNGDLSARVGTVVTRSFSNHNYDSEIIAGQFEAYTFNGPSTSNTKLSITGQHLAAKNETICAEGSETGGNCGWKVLSARDECAVFSDFTETCHLGIAQRVSGTNLLAGDSGGPVIFKASNGTYAVGSIVGSSDDSTPEMYYHDMPELLSKWGASLGTR